MFVCCVLCYICFSCFCMSAALPDTLTPEGVTLTPNSIFLTPKIIWGRLCPMISGVGTVDLDGSSLKVGRHDDCHILDKMNPKYLGSISKYHFEIFKEQNYPAQITDLSKNGTFLNGVLIGRGKTNILQNNDEISMGFKLLKIFVFKNYDTAVDMYLPITLQKKYEVSRLLGNGACGEVKLIYDKYTCRPYAIKKIVKAFDSQNSSGILRHPTKIYNEVKILQSLEHPCIISVIDVVDTPENIFIIMDYMAGGELTNLIRGPVRLTEHQAKFLFYQMVSAVNYLHSQRIIHRDLKPENVLLRSSSVNTLIKVSDFGLSKIIEEETVMKTVCGTPNYVAPEVLDSKINRYTGKVDVWSLGVILFYMLSQQLPFRAHQKTVLFKQILSGNYTMPGSFSSISASCKNLLKNMLLVNADERLNINDIMKHSWLNDHNVMVEVDELMYSESQTVCLDSFSEESFSFEETIHSSKKIKLLKD